MPLVDHAGLATVTAQLSGLGSAVLTLVGASVIVHRLVRASRRQRRVLAFPGGRGLGRFGRLRWVIKLVRCVTMT